MSKHTPTPWEVTRGKVIWIDSIYEATGPIATLIPEVEGVDDQDANAVFIVKACNNHDALVSALGGLLTECALAAMDGVSVPADSEACRLSRHALKAVKS